MSQNNKNRAMVLTGYARWRDSGAKDVDYWLSIFADRFMVTSTGGGGGRPGYFRPSLTQADLRDYINGIRSEWILDCFEVVDTISDGDRLAVRLTVAWTSRLTGKTFESVKMDYWRFEGGKAVEYCEHFDTLAMENARRL